MSKRKSAVMVFSFLLMLLCAAPVYGGTWTQHEDDTWTYTDDDGESVTGWIEDDGKTYYFDEDGVMAADTWVDNYYVNSEGKWKGTR